MKRSELTTTGKTYRLTPDNWGDNSIMVDETAAITFMEKSLGCPCDPDADENNKPETVEIFTNSDGNLFAILEPFTRNGETHNNNMFKPCDDPALADNGLAGIYGSFWLIFEEEEEA